jgi:hypothetical protein
LQAEVHIVDNVLKPNPAAATAAAPPPVVAATATAASAPAAAKSPHGDGTTSAEQSTLDKKTITISKPFFSVTFTLPALIKTPVAMPPATVSW